MRVGDITIDGVIVGSISIQVGKDAPVTAAMSDGVGDGSAPAGFGLHLAGLTTGDAGSAGGFGNAYPSHPHGRSGASGGRSVRQRAPSDGPVDHGRWAHRHGPAQAFERHEWAGHKHGPAQLFDRHRDRWGNYLAGISYLETTHHNEGNTKSSAQGYFQFLRGTARRATGAGIDDPRQGSYGSQAAATQKYIERFHPKAAAAINRGDYDEATRQLRGEWPSLPGGNQQQIARRYDTWREVIAGRGPRPPGDTGARHDGPERRDAAAANVPFTGAGNFRDLSAPATAHLGDVDPRLREVMSAAATHLPAGYKVQVTPHGGYGAHHGDRQSQHRRGTAMDVQIVGPEGAIPNRGSDPTGMYQRLARSAYGEMLARHPELKGKFSWGGAHGTQGRGGGPRDLMHFDIGGERGHLDKFHPSRMGAQPGEAYGRPPSTNKAKE